jgi:hypothetical protein
MKERLVEDRLTRINERGYQTAFGQTLLSRGFRVLRISHGPYEHGKDVLAISPENEVHCYQLKDDDIDIKQWEHDFGQICALVQSRPSHPALPNNYVYRPFIVTNGIFTDPALDRIHQHNKEWERLGYPRLTPVAGKELHRDLVTLASDFWPVEPPDVRKFRSLYLVDGRGDFVPDDFARFIRALLTGEFTPRDLERRVAAANVFASYLLGEYYRQEDHWSVFRGWILAAAHIAWAAERNGRPGTRWNESFELAKDAAIEALSCLASECATEKAFMPKGMELDEYTCLRNTVAVGAWAALCIIAGTESSRKRCIEVIEEFTSDGRLWFWGEGAFSGLLVIVWLLEQEKKTELARNLLLGFAIQLAANQQKDSITPLSNPYVNADEVLKKTIEARSSFQQKKRRNPVQSFTVLPLTFLMVRRNMRNELEQLWPHLSHVTLTHFDPDKPWGYLEWHCDEGAETDQMFAQPQSWKELVEFAAQPAIERLPEALRSDFQFSPMFLLAYPHRINWSIIGNIDGFSSRSK